MVFVISKAIPRAANKISNSPRMRVVLLELHLMFTNDLGVLIKNDKPRARRPTIHTAHKLSLLLLPATHQVAHPKALASQGGSRTDK